MKKFRVYATYSVLLYADIEAKDEHEAFNKGVELDGADFIEVTLGDWNIDGVEELKE